LSRGDGVPKPHLRDGVAWAARWAVREDEASAPSIIEPGFMQRPVPSPSTSAPIEQNQRRPLDAVEQLQGGRPVVGVEGDAHLPGRAGLLRARAIFGHHLSQVLRIDGRESVS